MAVDDRLMIAPIRPLLQEPVTRPAALRLSQGQVVLLDGIRGISAQLVLFGHVVYANGMELARYWPDLGVVCFLVISGFLITSSALSKGSHYRFDEFIIDRGSRIYSAYLPSLAFIIACGLIFELPGRIDVWHFMTNLLLLQNFPVPSFVPFKDLFEAIGTGRPLWTLSAEWWFYWAFGALYFYSRSNSRGWLLLLIGLPGFVIVVVQSARWVLAYPWIVGSLGAFFMANGPTKNKSLSVLAVALSGLAVTRYFNHRDFYDLQGILLTSAAIVCAIRLADGIVLPRSLATIAHFFASYSFSLYLLNATVIAVCSKFLAPGPVSLFTMCVASHAIALANYYLAERHYRTIAARIKLAAQKYGGMQYQRSAP